MPYLRDKLARLERRRPRARQWHCIRIVGQDCGEHAACVLTADGQHQAARPACDCPAAHIVWVRRVLAAGGAAEG